MWVLENVIEIVRAKKRDGAFGAATRPVSACASSLRTRIGDSVVARLLRKFAAIHR